MSLVRVSANSRISLLQLSNLGRTKSRYEPMLEKTLKTILSDRKTLCLIINEKHQLLHVYGNCEGISTVPQDKLTREVVQMIVPSLKRLLNTALHRAKEHKPNSTGELTSIPNAKILVT